MEKLPAVNPSPSLQGSLTSPLAQSTSHLAMPSSSSGSQSPSGIKALAGSVLGSAGTGLLGGLISGGMNLLGDHINYNRQKQMYAQQRADALADYDKQRADYLADIADERAYNTPAAQAARLKEAGINPNTVFGSGSVANTSNSVSNSAGLRGASYPGLSSSSLGSSVISGMSGVVQSSLAHVQAQQMQSNIELQKAEMLRMLSETKGIDEKTKAQMIENGWLDFMYESELRERNQRVNESLDRMQTAALERLSTEFDLKFIKPAEVEQIKATTSKLYAELKSVIQQYNYFRSVSGIRYAQERSQWLYDEAMRSFESEMNSFKVPSEAETGFGRIYRRVMHEAEFITKSALGWFSGSYNFGGKKK